MITKGIILAVILFILDLLIFTTGFLGKKGKKLAGKELAAAKRKLEFNIPFSLLLQVFLALVIVSLYIVLVAGKIFARNLSGALSFALLIYLPMLYLIVNSWLWADKDLRNKLAPSIYSWLAKFLATGLFLGLAI